MTRDALHELVDRIPESGIATAQRLLQHLVGNASIQAALDASRDDEPITAGDAEAIARDKIFRRAGWFLMRRFSANSACNEVCLV